MNIDNKDNLLFDENKYDKVCQKYINKQRDIVVKQL